MNPASHASVALTHPLPPPRKTLTDEETAHLREVLKRCSAATFQAACQFWKTGNPYYLPTIILGIIERFVASDLRPPLKKPHDDLRLGEDLGLDSLTMMEIVMLTEDVLALSIHHEELPHLRTLGDIQQFLKGKLHDQSRAMGRD